MRILSPALALGLAIAPAIAQIPCFDSTLGTNLNLLDESFSAPQALGFTFNYGAATYTDVQVGSNGFLVFGLGAPGAANYTPSVFELLNDPVPRFAALWMDFNPAAAGGGGVYARAVAATANHPAYFSVTYAGVYRFGTTQPHTIQVRLVADHSIEVCFGADVANNVGSWVHGASPGNNATFNSVDFRSLPILTSGNPTLHQSGSEGVPLADSVFKWSPDGVGGYIVTSAPACAANEKFGSGCVASYRSFYELFRTTRDFDLSNTAITGLFSAGGYVMLPGTTTFVAPSPNAVSLALGDDAEASVQLPAPLIYPGGSTSTLFVCSNGFISVGSNGTGYQPSGLTMLSRVNASWNVWHDFICNASNNVMFEVASGTAYFTWDAVVSTTGLTTGVTPSTFQFQFELATGNFHIVFQSMDTVSISSYQAGDGYLVGFSPSGASINPGSIDLSAVLPTTFTTGAADMRPLALTAASRPVLGTTTNLIVSDIPAGTPFGAVLLGFTGYNPGQSLTGIGMPGCFRFTDGLASVLFIAPSATATVPFAVPTGAVWIGYEVFCQGVSYSPPLTALGAIASNGVQLELGN